jgi:pimeloyl-ACP methyl ester carboxylesterase
LPFIESIDYDDKLRIYYEIFGRDNTKTVILIHPIGGNIEIWKDEISLILKKNLRIVTYEIRGHNRSNMGSRNDFTISDLVQDLKILTDRLEIDKSTLIGHSIGGSVASVYAAQFRKNVDGMILINGSSIRVPDEDLEKHRVTRKIALTDGMEALAQWIRHDGKESEKAFEDEKTWKQFEQIFTKTSVQGFVAATNSLYSMPIDVTTSLENANYGIFGIVGDGDIVFLRLMNKMRQEIPRFELRVIKDSDHWLIVEHPEELFSGISEFLDKIYLSAK